MNTPFTIMGFSAFSFIISMFLLFVNWHYMVNGKSSLHSGSIRHMLIGIWVSGSVLAFILGVTVFIIQYAKHA